MSIDWTAVREYRTALRALHERQDQEISAGITEETPEYLRLNAHANKLAERVPWLLR